MDHHAAFSAYAARLRELILKRPLNDHWLDADENFDQLARELFALQFQHNEVYQRYCRHRGINPTQVRHWTKIPALPASAFKEWEVTVLDQPGRSHFFLSSGTTTQHSSRHFHSTESIQLYEDSAWVWFQSHLLPQRERVTPYGWVCLTPPPKDAPHSSLVHMFDLVRRQVGSDSFGFLGRTTANGGWEVDVGSVLKHLDRFMTRQQSVIVLGTAFSFVNLLDELTRQKLSLQLPLGSGALETGGYKGRSRTVPKAELHHLLTARLGLRPDRIVNEFGMSELSSQAYDRMLAGPGLPATETSGAFRFPPWARAHVVSPETADTAAPGQPGLLRVVDLANVWSLAFIQTSDLAAATQEGFQLRDRAAHDEPRGCSLMSQD